MPLAHHFFELVTKAHALCAVSLALSKQLLDLSHLDRALDLIDLQIALVKLTALLPNRALIAVNQLLSIGVLLLVRE